MAGRPNRKYQHKTSGQAIGAGKPSRLPSSADARSLVHRIVRMLGAIMKNRTYRFTIIVWGLFLIFLIVTKSYSETYYVDAVMGNDNNSGLSEHTPWKTIHKVNAMNFNRGDSILFKCGGTWREQLIPQNGDEYGYLVYAAYGTGNKPQILGSVSKANSTQWVNVQGNIWSTIPATKGYEVGEELLTNPSFDTNTGGWGLWYEGGANAVGGRDIVDYHSPPASYKIECLASGQSGNHIQFFTTNIAIETGNWYKLTFKAKSSQEFEIHDIVLMQATSPWNSYANDIIADDLSIVSDWKTYNVLFKANATDPNANIIFYIGGVLPEGAEFHLDSFSFKKFEFSEELLTNPSFDVNADGWNLWYEGGANAIGGRDVNDYHSPPASYKIECMASGQSGNHIQFFKTNVAIVSGNWYKLTFKAKSSKDFEISDIALMRATSPWTSYATDVIYGDLTVKSSWQSYSVLFKANATDINAEINFYLGGVLPEGASFHLDSFSFQKYENNEPILSDVGNLIFNNEASFGIKVWNEEDLDEQGEFFYDKDEYILKIYSVSNPAEYYSNIECALNNSNIKIHHKNYIIIENFDLRYSGSLGVDCFNVSNIIIRKCDISYIGGSEQPGTDHIVRYGNGIQFWQTADNCIVERNKIWQVYDAALTNQGLSTNSQTNIYYRNNIIRNCEYSYEFWDRDQTSVVNNIFFEHNTCVDAGDVWSHDQRPDNANGNHLLFYNNTAQTTNFHIRNNIFYQSTEQCMRMDNDWTNGLDLDYNCWHQSSGRMIWLLFSDSYNMAEFSTYQTETGFDVHSIAADPLFKDFDDNNFQLQSNSPCINGALDVGLADDFNGNLRPEGTLPDIGALEYVPESSAEDGRSGLEDLKYGLLQNYPNPFNSLTTIVYQIPFSTRVELTIHNILGQCVKTLVNKKQNRGEYTIQWSGINENGLKIVSGIYFYKLKTIDFTETRKMLLLQ
jgi:hypothetical protein